MKANTVSNSYKELLAQREALEAQIQAARKQEVSDVVAKIRSLVADYALTAEDIFTSKRTSKASVSAPKYRDPSTGKTWTGRGKPPDWIKGQNREDFAI
nr:H-NS histone family protein [Delftia tsuruhatensis]